MGVIDAVPVTLLDTREVPDILSDAQEWIFRVGVKLFGALKIVLLVLVSNRNEDQCAVVLGGHCQERNEINNHRKETEIDI